jgi:orotate phosphoribosyltransferase
MSVDLVPPPEKVMEILTTTGAYRKGHFIYPNGKHASHYFQMPLAFRLYDNARILSVGLSRLFRMENPSQNSCPRSRSSAQARPALWWHSVCARR